MSTIKDKLNFIKNCKYEIGNAIINKLYEQDIYDFDSSILSNYANRINSLNIASIGDLKKIGYEPLFSDLYLEYGIEFKNKWEQSDKTNLNALYDQNYYYKYIKFFPIIDTSKVTSLKSTFSHNEVIYFPYDKLDFTNVLDCEEAFYSFKSIPKLILNAPKATNFTRCFVFSNIYDIDISKCISANNFNLIFNNNYTILNLKLSFKNVNIGNKDFNPNLDMHIPSILRSLKIYDLGYKPTFTYFDITLLSREYFYSAGTQGSFIGNNYEICFDRRSAGYEDCEIVTFANEQGVYYPEEYKQQFENKGYKFTTKPIPL